VARRNAHRKFKPPFPLCTTISLVQQAVNRAVRGEDSPYGQPFEPDISPDHCTPQVTDFIVAAGTQPRTGTSQSSARLIKTALNQTRLQTNIAAQPISCDSCMWCTTIKLKHRTRGSKRASWISVSKPYWSGNM
jgi:hypothetical protein